MTGGRGKFVIFLNGDTSLEVCYLELFYILFIFCRIELFLNRILLSQLELESVIDVKASLIVIFSLELPKVVNNLIDPGN